MFDISGLPLPLLDPERDLDGIVIHTVILLYGKDDKIIVITCCNQEQNTIIQLIVHAPLVDYDYKLKYLEVPICTQLYRLYSVPHEQNSK